MYCAYGQRSIVRNFLKTLLTMHTTLSLISILTGSGVQCDTGHGVVLVGNRALMDEQQVRVLCCILCVVLCVVKCVECCAW